MTAMKFRQALGKALTDELRVDSPAGVRSQAVLEPTPAAIFENIYTLSAVAR